MTTHTLIVGSFVNGFPRRYRRRSTVHRSYAVQSAQPIGTWANGYAKETG